MAANDSTPSGQVQEHVCDLWPGMSIWRVDINSIREMDKNARVMRKDKFEQLTANIAKDSRLESLPLCTMKTTPTGKREFLVLSGHHRTRAARKAMVLEIFILVIESLTDDEIKSKQLAHNSLNGEDDAQTLAEIYNSISAIEERIRTGIKDNELAFDPAKIQPDNLAVNLDFEIMQIAFFPHQKEEFEDMIKYLSLKPEVLNVADMKDFTRLKATLRKVAANENVRNLSAILMRICAIVKAHYEAEEAAKDAAK